MRDPLAGQRQAINERRASSLMWVDEGQPCPVRVGDVISLRSCTIEITDTRRIKHEGRRKWRAAFTRFDHVADPVFLLGRSGDYTDDPKQAAGLRDDIHQAATLDVLEEEDRTLEHKNAGDPLEPEAVPPHEISNYKGSIEAQQRYERDVAERRVAEASAPLEVRLARLRAEACSSHVDISSDLFVIEQRIEKAERKVLERAAA